MSIIGLTFSVYSHGSPEFSKVCRAKEETLNISLYLMSIELQFFSFALSKSYDHSYAKSFSAEVILKKWIRMKS